MLTRGAAAEVLFSDQDFCALVLRLVQHKIGVRLAGIRTVLDAAPVIEEKIFVAGALNPLQELLGDDLVGIDVGQGQRGGGAGEDLDGFH